MSPGTGVSFSDCTHAETGAKELGFGNEASGGLYREANIEGVSKHADMIHIQIIAMLYY